MFSQILQNEFILDFINNLRASDLRDVLDILIVTLVVYGILNLVRKTRSGQLARGALLLLVVYAVADTFRFRTVAYLLQNVLQIGLLSLVVVFQPEIRRALEQVGRTDQWAGNLFKMHRNDDATVRAKWKNAIVAVCDSAEQLSEERTGGLIVMERGTNLSEIIRTGTLINADVTLELLGTVFYEGTPLHDGAVVIRDGVLKAAGCVLPLSNNLEISKDMGTRHRAALGMSENSDAVIVVVSEETGIISLAKNGVLIRRLDRQNLFNLLMEEIVPPETEKKTKKQPFWRKKHEKV